jgi:hypothetical protein
MSVINFIRLHKLTSIEDLPASIRAFDSSISTSSPYLVYYKLFQNHYEGLNYRRLVELLRWINTKMNQLPPVSSTEQTMSKIRKLVKEKWEYESKEYKASLANLVFDRPTKFKKIKDYEAKIANENRNTTDLPVSLINKIFEDNKECETFQQMLTYLLLDSGSRLNEIYTGVYKNDGHGFISMSNISKSRDRTRIVKKELLTQDSTKFIKVLKQYRELNKPIESAIVQLNAYLREKYGFTSYHLRKYFGNVAYFLLENKNITQNAFLSSILGHSDDQTAKVYSSFNVVADTEPTFRTSQE